MNKPTNLFLFAANTAEMIHSSGVEVHDPFPYIKTTNGNEFVLLDGREYEIVKKILKAKKSKVVVEKLEDYVELAKKKSVKDKKFANLSLQEKVLICFLEEKKMKEFFVSENLESKWLLFLKKYGFKIDLQDLSSQRRYKTQP